jgi:hypothetical protein
VIGSKESTLQLAWRAGTLVMAITACASDTPDLGRTSAEEPVLARVVAQAGSRWLLQACGEDFECEPPTGVEFFVEVQNPYAADLRIGRRVFVSGEAGGTVGGKPLILVTDEQGIDPRDEDGGG